MARNFDADKFDKDDAFGREKFSVLVLTREITGGIANKDYFKRLLVQL